MPLNSDHDGTVQRIVTGMDGGGRSCVLFQDAAPLPPGEPGGINVSSLWSSAEIPIDNSGRSDMGAADLAQSAFSGAGYSMVRVRFEPGFGAQDPGMHFTNTVDNIILMSGELALVLETGEVTMRPGDVLVIRGHVHGWRNDGAVPAMAVVVSVPAEQVSKGQKAF